MTDHTSTVTIRDVMPRDGLQAEAPLSADIRANLAIELANAGLAHVEAASFVSPKAVPSMAGGADVFRHLPKLDGGVVGAGSQPARRASWRWTPGSRASP